MLHSLYVVCFAVKLLTFDILARSFDILLPLNVNGVHIGVMNILRLIEMLWPISGRG